ncbi:MAG TPA: UDP-glucose 4-epimerase GalE [Termitinemataceae bacterium]|jgi:UDP-glucose 4-epimerase|uniref:UDP-glucose 4-epimerase GalE n=1 Tax=Treponema sp. J25 TaxID=2094121 RepID=UPI00104BC5F9|nr:UDP-glucose 4-epimerase GalE [Treponema sp. J25]TCW62362.1 UDP-glucose 4-epimerase GalE [Treponema sp. J25]HOJ98690.1 UDP-glucose 4-epimerase GalE [Termitinemataceae bacterium]HOM24165.1 UDP-glucose 4-epimerase GalE [Termitinemataceae bacterium]HPQ01186.1 UDP-glucose 4-epimerase GalE [Termitinemataceae bacterium]
MKILVIGGAGYIGSHVAREFLDQGHEVVVFDNLSSGTEENLFPEERFIRGDIMDYPFLEKVMSEGFDALVHLAAFKAAGESMIKPEKYSLNNINGTIHILNAACATGIRYIVFSSSAATYGEPRYLPIDEEHPTNPENYYGFTKLEIERFLSWYDKLKGIKYAALRYFNAAGYDIQGRIRGLERNPANLLPVVMETACGIRPEVQVFGNDYDTIDGTGVRDYIHVNDLAVGHVSALEYIMKHNTSLTVNLGSETGLSVLQIIEAARRITGRPIPARIVGRRPGDPAKLTASAKKARELLGWQAKYSDVDTLVQTSWEVYRPHAR